MKAERAGVLEFTSHSQGSAEMSTCDFTRQYFAAAVNKSLKRVQQDESTSLSLYGRSFVPA